MSKYEEKMKALAVLKAAVDKVDDALEAIDAFADKLGIMPEKVRRRSCANISAHLPAKTGCRTITPD